MKKISRVIILTIVCVSLIWMTWGINAGCGGTNDAGGTTITLVVKDGSGTTINTTGSSLAANAYLNLTFSAALAAAPTTSEISLSCNSVAVTVTVNAATDTDAILTNEYNVVPASLTSGQTCTLTLAYASIADASDNKLSSSYGTYTFTVTAAAAATVNSFADASSNAVATTGTTSVNPTSFTLAFSTSMDVATVAHDNITMVCGPNAPVTLDAASIVQTDATTDTDGIADNEFSITPPTPYAYQLMSCTVTLGTGIKNSDAVAMTQATYTFTNGCAASDHFIYANTINFTTQTDGCWTIVQAGGAYPAQADDFTFIDTTLTEQLGMLRVTAGALWMTTNSPMLYKTISGSDTKWTVTSIFGDFGGTSGENSNYSIFVGNVVGTFMLSLDVVPDTDECQLQSMTNTTPAQLGAAPTCIGSDYTTVKLERSGSVFTASYAKDGATTYTQIGTYTDNDGNLSVAELALGMQFGSNVDNFISNVENFMIDGVTVSGQY